MEQFVYVQNKHGKPLMPCKPAKARHLLRDGKAKVVKKEPFTIQLLYGSSGYKQPITLGVDPGAKTVGLSASTEETVLFEAEAELRTDVPELLATRKEARTARRNRKTRYRKPRFTNRKGSKPKGLVAPSVQQKVDSHESLCKMVKEILPIKTVFVEIAKFDIQKILNPDIEGEDYQYGPQHGFYNVREYVLWRDNYTCQCCFGKSGDKNLSPHHIESRKTGGNAPNDQVTLCVTCHEGYHKGLIKLPPHIKRGKSFRDAAFMNITRQRVYDMLIKMFDDVQITYGYITKGLRIQNKLPKSHAVDARCIAFHPKAVSNEIVYKFRKVRRHNRKIYKDKTLKGGIRKRNQCPYEVFCFRRYDTVEFEGKRYYINSLRTNGHFQIKSLLDTTFIKELSYKKLRLLKKRGGWLSAIQKI